MSREVDKSDLGSLEDEDLFYLHQRNQITTKEWAEARGETEQQLAESLQQLYQNGIPLEDRPNTGTANTGGATAQEYEQNLRARNGVGDDDEDGEEEDDEAVPYEEQSNDDLRAELSRRGLSVSGKKEELIQRLEEDDESDEDEETE